MIIKCGNNEQSLKTTVAFVAKLRVQQYHFKHVVFYLSYHSRLKLAFGQPNS